LPDSGERGGGPHRKGPAAREHHRAGHRVETRWGTPWEPTILDAPAGSQARAPGPPRRVRCEQSESDLKREVSANGQDVDAPGAATAAERVALARREEARAGTALRPVAQHAALGLVGHLHLRGVDSPGVGQAAVPVVGHGTPGWYRHADATR